MVFFFLQQRRANSRGPAATRCTPTATAGVEKQFQHQHSNMRGFDHIETLSGAEDQWQNWSWKSKTAVSGMNLVLADVLDAAEADGVGTLEEISKEDAFVDTIEENVSRRAESCTVLARYMSSEASPIVRSATGLAGVKAWSRLHAHHSRRALGKYAGAT